MKKFNKGFTLIELLVVIAIIGILSSIVLASLSSARTKGEDAAIQSTLSNMRAQAELYYANNSDYSTYTAATACSGGMFASTGTGGLKTLVDAAKVRSTTVTCAAASTTWAVSALLKSGAAGATVYCVDSSGASKATSSQIVGPTCG
ncbi:MAG: prepilin-type N-terminal cleavage/methylation domain-containing protein [Patescibacteria group bacterium]